MMVFGKQNCRKELRQIVQKALFAGILSLATLIQILTTGKADLSERQTVKRNKKSV